MAPLVPKGASGASHSAHRRRRERLEVGCDIDDGRTLGRDRFGESRTDIARLLHANAERADILRDLGEVRRLVRPQFARAVVGLAAIDAVEAALGLVAAAVVVDQRHGWNVPAHLRFQFADVIPEARVAGEYDDRPVGTRRLRADASAKRPAEVAGAADVA